MYSDYDLYEGIHRGRALIIINIAVNNIVRWEAVKEERE